MLQTLREISTPVQADNDCLERKPVQQYSWPATLCSFKLQKSNGSYISMNTKAVKIDIDEVTNSVTIGKKKYDGPCFTSAALCMAQSISEKTGCLANHTDVIDSRILHILCEYGVECPSEDDEITAMVLVRLREHTQDISRSFARCQDGLDAYFNIMLAALRIFNRLSLSVMQNSGHQAVYSEYKKNWRIEDWDHLDGWAQWLCPSASFKHNRAIGTAIYHAACRSFWEANDISCNDMLLSLISTQDHGIWHGAQEDVGQTIYKEVVHGILREFCEGTNSVQHLTKWLGVSAYMDMVQIHRKSCDVQCPDAMFIKHNVPLGDVLFLRGIDGVGWAYSSESGPVSTDLVSQEAYALSVVPHDIFDLLRDTQNGEMTNIARLCGSSMNQMSPSTVVAELIAVSFNSISTFHKLQQQGESVGSIGLSIGLYTMCQTRSRHLFENIGITCSQLDKHTRCRWIEKVKASCFDPYLGSSFYNYFSGTNQSMELDWEPWSSLMWEWIEEVINGKVPKRWWPETDLQLPLMDELYDAWFLKPMQLCMQDNSTIKEWQDLDGLSDQLFGRIGWKIQELSGKERLQCLHNIAGLALGVPYILSGMSSVLDEENQ
ncbi:hypothetical protein K7432_008191 [Basidiobolus ranarum]|uniref:Uncharacterized protein n=1 Tax=Basidiobolus ranarum TaxID=34480 RepID=A0ABR2WSH1_9FUNG